VFDALRRRQSTFLADPEWRNISPRQTLYDPYIDLSEIIVDLPSILEHADRLRDVSSFSNTPATASRLYESAWSLCNKFHDWHHELLSEIPGLVYWPVPSSVPNPADGIAQGRVFPLSLQFESLHIAQLMLIYWSALALLYSAMYKVYSILQSPRYFSGVIEIPIASENMEISNCALDSCPSSISAQATAKWDMATPPSIEEMIRLAKCICQSVEYCYNIDRGTLGPQSTVFSLWAAKQAFLSQPGYERELAWCSEIKIHEGFGLSI
jgi:hypothetical protein